MISAAQRPAELADPDCLAADEAGALLAGHPWRRFAVLGDSVANGPIFEVPGFCPLRWTDRVAAELQAEAPELRYLNLGASGLLTSEVRDTQLADALAFGPDLALVLCGGNDAFRRSYTELRAEQVDQELAEILGPLREQGAQLATICIFDVSYSPAVPDGFRLELRERLARLAEHARATAKRFDCVHVDLARHRRATDASLYSPDGRHGNSRSDAIAAAELVRALGSRLASG
ncbi:MAG: SGNH/GDSL hydrolase family protein [Jatrophihabitantaceae bacterium]